MNASRQRQIFLALLGLACLVQIFLVVLARLDQNRIDDDAYMFVRYARNTMDHGTVSWNPGEAPTYGLTSLGYFAVVLLVQTALRVDAAWVLLVSTLLCGCAFIATSLWMAWRSTAAQSRTQRNAALLFVLLALAWGAEGLASHFVNGMDAAFALVFLSLYIVAARDWHHSPERVRVLWLGILGGAFLWVRPDILLYSFAVPAAVAVWPPSTRHRRSALTVLAITLATCIVLGSVAWAYFSTPLPLPVYSKVLRGYGPDMQQVYAAFPAEQLAIFARHHAVSLLLAGIGTILLLRQRGIASCGVEMGLAIATVGFLIFHRFFVLAIMGSHQRFYYPMLPAMLFLAAQCVVCLIATDTAQKLGRHLSHSPARLRLVSLAGGLLLLASLLPQAGGAWRSLQHATLFRNIAVLDHYRVHWWDYWLRLDSFSQLPDDLVIATTEVGYPGVMNPNKIIVDLAGLNDNEFARHGFSAPSLFGRYHPDLFYLPRSHYAALRDELTRSPEFRSNYEFFRPEKGLAIALRRDSRHYVAMRRVLGMR